MTKKTKKIDKEVQQIVKEKTSPRMQEIWNSITEFQDIGRNCGNSAHVRVPKAWIGKMIKVQLIEER